MKLNREQIVKALECCSADIPNCYECPYIECKPSLISDALALIRDLIEENEKLTINMNAYGLTAKRLAEENDRLRAETIDYRNIPYIIAEAKADTIRKMQERMMDTKTKICGDYYIYAENVNVIAQELLGE